MNAKLTKYLPLIALLIVYAVVGIIAYKENFSPQKIKDWVLGFGVIAPLVYILIYWLFVLIPSLPNPIVLFAGGLAFGTFWGFVLAYSASSLGIVTNFLLAKRFGRDYVRKIAGEKTIKEIDRISDLVGTKGIVIMRLVPGFSFDVVSYAAGLSKMSLKNFVSAFIVPQTLVVYTLVFTGNLAVTNPKPLLIVLGVSLSGFVVSSIYIARESIKRKISNRSRRPISLNARHYSK